MHSPSPAPSQINAHHHPDHDAVGRVERHRGDGLTAWAALWSGEGAQSRCAACGAQDRVQADPRCGGIPFCEDCSSWSRDLTEWDDLGRGD